MNLARLHNLCSLNLGLVFRYEAILSGSPDLAVLYNHKLYYFVTIDKLDKFMRFVPRLTICP